MLDSHVTHATQVNIERQLAARSETWQADSEAAPEVQDVQRLTLDEGPSPEKESAASEGDNATKAAVEVAASAAAAAAPAPEEDEWLYRDPKGNVQVGQRRGQKWADDRGTGLGVVQWRLLCCQVAAVALQPRLSSSHLLMPCLHVVWSAESGCCSMSAGAILPQRHPGVVRRWLLSCGPAHLHSWRL